MNEQKITARRIAFAGVGGALVFAATFFIRIPIPATDGYLNLGDAVILLVSFILGPFAFFPAAIGSALADLVAGYAHYALPTFIIKGGVGALAGFILKKNDKRLIAFVLGEILMVLGYLLVEIFLYGVSPALASSLFNLIQGAAGVAVALILTSFTFFKKQRLK